MERCLTAAPAAAQSDDAKRFLSMTALDRPSADVVAAEPQVQQILKMQPLYVPALMAKAAIQLQRNDAKAAANIYLQVLNKYPDFAPAQKRLAAIYADSADKAARFVMDCNQTSLPIIFFQDVTGFMVGRDAEESGIIRSGAKLVNAVSNSVVPKITVVVGGSFGAGNYAMCGKAYDPRFIIAWPTARYAVMGAAQASDTVFAVLARARERDKKSSPEELEELRTTVKKNYEEQTDIRYGAARGWVDAIIEPHETRDVLIRLLQYISRPMPKARFHTGVIQV